MQRQSMMKKQLLLPLVLALAAPGWAGQSASTDSVLGLAQTADAIVLTSCDDGASRWTGDPPIIVTRHQCRVERAFKGQPGDTISVQVLGGRVGDVTMNASTGLSVGPGVDAVLLLRRSEFGPYYVIAGGSAGVLPVTGARERRSVQGMSLEAFGHWVTP
jgi:hypothetical protein